MDIKNYGIITSALSTSDQLDKLYNFKTEIWSINKNGKKFIRNFENVNYTRIKKPMILYSIFLLYFQGLNKKNTIIITNGAWRFPTLLGYIFKLLGFKWIYVPHGMLEDWSLNSKQFKKKLYFILIEKNLVIKADLIRAVSEYEKNSLSKYFNQSKIEVVPNVIKIYESDNNFNFSSPINILFMGRLNKKKGIVPLVESWGSSILKNDPDYQLIIAGSDDGELSKVLSILSEYKINNANYIGEIFGDHKHSIFKKSSFFILPSYSEGLPISVIEAMQYGLVCLITKGCNLTESFKYKAAIEIFNDKEALTKSLNQIPTYTKEDLEIVSKNSKKFIHDFFDAHKVALLQKNIYERLINNL
jgi:glycosyltransferase involved in cell wall biosynthesis